LDSDDEDLLVEEGVRKGFIGFIIGGRDFWWFMGVWSERC